MEDNAAILDSQLVHIDLLASKSLDLWDLPEDARISRINVAENVTYLIESASGYKSVLRVHRANYHTEKAIEGELKWIRELNSSGTIQTPHCYVGRNGKVIQKTSIPELPNSRYMVLFEFIEGMQPDEEGNVVAHFEGLGEIAAKLHKHSINWPQSGDLERQTWDTESVFGKNAIWGNWRDAPQMTDEIVEILELVEDRIRNRLAAYGKSRGRFGLIHADMRLTNLLVDGRNTRIIDFDDCGYGWFMYDFAAAVSFMEDDPRIPDMKQSWLMGYQTERALYSEDVDVIDTLVMLRRMALLAWIGSRIEAPEPQALSDGFASTTAELGLKFLKETS